MSSIKDGGKVTIELTQEQKKEIKETLGLNWDSITIDKGISLEDIPRLAKADLNIVVAMGETHVIS